MQPIDSADAGIDVRHCRNIDEQASLLETWNQEYCQLSRGAFAGSVSTIRVGGVRVLIEHLNRTVYQRGLVAPGRIAVGIPFELEGHALLCGQSSHRDGLHVFSGDGGFEFLSPDKHVVVNLEIEPGLIQDPLVAGELPALLNLLGPVAGVREVHRDNMNAFRTTLTHLLDTAALTPRLFSDAGTAAAFEKAIVFGLLDLLRSPVGHDQRAPIRDTARNSRNWQLVRAVRELVEESPDCPLSVAEICGRFHASRRALQYAFEGALGIKPNAYLRAVRLDHVRRELLSARSVTEAATRWGFWHFGNFSSEYRTQFGELPSQTIQRARRLT